MTHGGFRGITVLVVEDEPAIRQLLAHALGRGGLRVLSAGRGEEAVEVYRAHAGGIDLVLIDVQMSPWDGPKTLAELKRVDPTVRAAFMSGSSDVYPVDELLALGALRVFPKPFTSITDLADTLADLVGAA